ncbi:hypothetical protein VTL71DRAFT_8939 [Oculimacula yallundae]|uniref:Uncharacterized protein n=1 Tax=Oculimacula yallundae TaxID=86028 RepID=A0ABR4BU48_9HELO
MEKEFYSNALDSLCSKDQLELLNSIDCLRSQGISHYVSLPQIIVCGDQSSGKSSVLEAISGVSFPIKSNLSTRFPTELVLRKSSHSSVSVSIVPHESRSEAERLALGSFHEKLDGFEGLSNLVENAKSAMGISTHGKAFSKDLLRVEVSGPDRPHLTIVDLPGLIHSETKHQSASDVELVQDVVQDYMKEPRSIILAVVSAKNDYANQVVLKLARTADKEGRRTLGVITKPDMLVPESESEAMYTSLAKNQDVEFRLGWHVLRNLDSELGKWSLADRDAKETEFFSTGIWQYLDSSILGVEKLRKRLSTVLLGQIAAELPSLISEIEAKSEACKSKLEMLREPRATLQEQRLYLLHISQSFQNLVKASVDGTYNDTFFEDARSDAGYRKRLRAVVQNLNLDFAEHITSRGHSQEVTSSPQSCVPKGVLAVTRDDFLNQVQTLLKRTRGRELPGTFNPMIVVDLFLEQSARWEMITRRHVEKVWRAAKEFLGLTKSHPITYNHYFTDTLQKVRNERNKDDFARILQDFFRTSSIDKIIVNQQLDLGVLLNALVQRTEPDMNRFACSEALDCMEAYYKVALKRFIDDIAVEIIEVNLLSLLHEIFSPITVTAMADALVTSIAGESEESRTQRDQFMRQLEVLRNGLETCKRFVGVRILGTADNAMVSGWASTKYDSDESDDDSGNVRSLSTSPSVTSVPLFGTVRGSSMPVPVEAPWDEPAEEFVPAEMVEEPVVDFFPSSSKKVKKGKSATKKTSWDE